MNYISKIKFIMIVSYKEVDALFVLGYIRLGEFRLDLSGKVRLFDVRLGWIVLGYFILVYFRLSYVIEC